MNGEETNMWSELEGLCADDVLEACREVHEKRERLNREFRQWLKDQGFSEHEEKHMYVVARGPNVLIRAETPERLLTDLSGLESLDGVEIFQADMEFFGDLREQL